MASLILPTRRRLILGAAAALASAQAAEALTPGQRAAIFGTGGITLNKVFGGASGFYFDFTSGATGAGISSVNSLPPGTASASQAAGTAQPTWTAGSPSYALFNGSSDFLTSTLNPSATAMTIAICFNGAASNFLMGVSGATNQRCYLGLTVGAQLAGGWGSDSTSTIFGGPTIASTNAVGLMRVNGSTVELWMNGVQYYKAAANGPPTTTLPIPLGCRNSNGTVSNLLTGQIYRVSAIQRFIDNNQVVPFMRMLGKGVVSF